MRRDSNVSVAKAMGIILMVIGHSSCPGIMFNFIYLFHVPLFFFLSGYFFSSKNLISKKEFVVKRIKGLYIPFVKWSLIFLFLHNFFFLLGIYNASTEDFDGLPFQLYDFHDYINRFMQIVFAMTGNESLLGGYWFLRDLLLSSLLAIFFLTAVNRVRIRLEIKMWILVFLSLVFIYFISWIIPSDKVVNLGVRGLFATSLYSVGYLYHHYEKFIKYNWIGFLFSFFILLIASLLYPRKGPIQYMSVIYFIMIAVIGIYFILNLSRLICRSKLKNIFMYIGDRTMIILTFHFISFKIYSLILIYQYDLNIKHLAEFPVIKQNDNLYAWICYTFVGIGIPLSVAYLIDKIKGKNININNQIIK